MYYGYSTKDTPKGIHGTMGGYNSLPLTALLKINYFKYSSVNNMTIMKYPLEIESDIPPAVTSQNRLSYTIIYL